MLLPKTCPLCGRPGPAPCAACAAELERSPSLPPPPGVDTCVALLAYEDAGRDLIARLKYRNARSPLRWLVVLMASLVRALRFDGVTWMPTTSTRRHERGFDQAQLLARGIARELHVPCRRLLLRAPGPPQTGRSLADRRRGPVLRAPPGQRVPAHVLLVDDVITTGTSVSIAARELRRAGATRVTVVAAGRTPLKRARAPSETECNGAG